MVIYHYRRIIYRSKTLAVSLNMKKLQLRGKYGNGKFAIVDDSDFENLSSFGWHCSKLGYVCRKVHSGGVKGKVHQTRKTRTIFLHHIVLGNPKKGMVTDHINMDTLDNRKKNLRFATHSQNHANEPKQKNNTSGYKGVWLNKLKSKDSKKWVANILFQGKKQCLGIYFTPEEAAQAYNIKAKELFGEFALLNNV